jgi:peroxiredoxin
MLLAVLALPLTSLSSQTTKKDAGSTPTKSPTTAASDLAKLNALHAKRIKAISDQDVTARTKVTDTHVEELAEFLLTHGESTQALQIRLKIGSMALRNDRYRKAAEVALNGYIPTAGKEGAALLLARTADRLKLTESKALITQKLSDQAKTITAKMDLVMQFNLGLKDLELGKQLEASAEAMATTDELKAELLIGKANYARAADPEDKKHYRKILREVAAKYPGTKYGKLARNKIAAKSLAIGSQPIPFEAEDIKGQKVSLDGYKGKVLLVDFWATWCTPCMQELPSLVAAYDKYQAQGFEILGVSLDRESRRSRLEWKITEQGMRWRHICDGLHWQAAIAQMYDVTSIPYTILIGKDGKIAGLDLHGEQLDQAIAKALNKK